MHTIQTQSGEHGHPCRQIKTIHESREMRPEIIAKTRKQSGEIIKLKSLNPQRAMGKGFGVPNS